MATVDMREGIVKYFDWRARFHLMRLALAGRCRDEGDWVLRWYERWWFTAKCILAVWLGWGNRDPNMIMVCYFDWGPTFDGEVTGASGNVLVVSRKGVGCDVIWDGWP